MHTVGQGTKEGHRGLALDTLCVAGQRQHGKQPTASHRQHKSSTYVSRCRCCLFVVVIIIIVVPPLLLPYVSFYFFFFFSPSLYYFPPLRRFLCTTHAVGTFVAFEVYHVLSYVAITRTYVYYCTRCTTLYAIC